MNNRHSISSMATILQALEKLNTLPGGRLTLFVVDASNKVCGTLTDGDVRRALLKGISLNDACISAAHAPFRSVLADKVDVALLRRYRSEGITLVPALDSEGCLVDIIDLYHHHSMLPLSAILMAGGKGERLRPATLTTPKPLLTIEGKAIIDYNIEALAACGITDITVATGYLAHKLEEHFSTPVAGVDVKTVCETSPLGTIGAATLCECIQRDGNTLIMNSDLLTTISFEEMYLTHVERNADITIAAIPYQVSVPFAILSTDDTDKFRVTALAEKPSYSYYANAGIYIINNEILRTLTPGERCDATTLIERALADNRLVTYYPIKGTWIDVGTPVDFRQAAELMKHHNSMKNANP